MSTVQGFIAKDLRPWNVINNTGFCVKTIEPQCQIPLPQTIADNVTEKRYECCQCHKSCI